ncbi:unnamed protein product [Calypogeia fissa]
MIVTLHFYHIWLLVPPPSPQSRFIVTSRDWVLLRGLDGIYEVPLLDKKHSQELFRLHAFPKQAIVPAKLEHDMVVIVEKCDGLPLTLEVIGNYLKTKRDDKFWKQTLQALEKAEAIQDLDKRLWAKLRLSYDRLDETEKHMFLNATTFFSMGYLTLREAKAAWRKAYEKDCEDLRWHSLVDRSLVYDVEEDKRIKVHEQLRSLGQKIAVEYSNNSNSRVWETKMALKLLQNKDLENQAIHALRLSYKWDGRHDLKLKECDFDALPESFGKLSTLRHLELKDSRNLLFGITFCQLSHLQYLEISGNCSLIQIKELPESLAELTALSHLILHCFCIRVRESDYEGAVADMCPENLGVLTPKSESFLLQERGIIRRFMGDLQGALEDLTAALEVCSDVDAGQRYLYDCWKHRGFVNFLLGDLDGAKNDGDTALALLPEYRHDEVFRSPSLGETSVMYMHFRLARRRQKVDEVWELMDSAHSRVMGKVRESDFQGALACWEVIDASLYDPDLRLFFLQERGVLKRLAGDVHGAVRDLSAALEIYREEDEAQEVSKRRDMKYCTYNCRKHRGFVKFLLGDSDGAQKVGVMALKLISCDRYPHSERLISPNLGEELLEYMHFKLYPTVDLCKQENSKLYLILM